MFIDEFIVWSWEHRPDIKRIGKIAIGMLVATIIIAALVSGAVFTGGFALVPALIFGAIMLAFMLPCTALAVANLTYQPSEAESEFEKASKKTWKRWFKDNHILKGKLFSSSISAASTSYVYCCTKTGRYE